MGINQEGNWSDMLALMAGETKDYFRCSVYTITKSASDA
jgi:hypothetical protein